MKTLVYFASGPYRIEYQELNFDKIYLIDNCFRNKKKYEKKIFTTGKVTCLGMDCLKAVDFLKRHQIKIDCFVSLNEGLFEGGGQYAINSDFFLGYAMPLMKDNYIHIMNKQYYQNHYKISMDLPFKIEEIAENNHRYLNPSVFSKNDYHKYHAKVYQMTRINSIIKINLNPKLKISLHHDSIWNYSEELDYTIISLSQQGQGDFFDHSQTVINIKQTSIENIFSFCNTNKIRKIGFTPWARGAYGDFIKRLENYQSDYPKEILLFHLNNNDYKAIKEYGGNKKF